MHKIGVHTHPTAAEAEGRDTRVTGAGAAPQPQILVNWLLISADISFKYSLKEKIKIVSIRITILHSMQP